jgi:hypothetical protein
MPTNLIPAMTSNTTPSGVASANSDYDGAYPPWKAMDHVNPSNVANGSIWVSASAAPWWIQYQFASPTVVSSYAVEGMSDGYLQQQLGEWTFQGWNGSTWTILDSQTGHGNSYWAPAPQKHTYSFTNSTAYSAYRLYITKSSGYFETSEQAYMTPGEIEFYGSTATTNIKSVSGVLQASIKKVSSIAIANIKKISGVS